MKYRVKSTLLAILMLSSTSTLAEGRIYVCSLKPFVETFIGVGTSEQWGRLAARATCEQSQGTNSMFCNPDNASCQLYPLYGDPYYRPYPPPRAEVFPYGSSNGLGPRVFP